MAPEAAIMLHRLLQLSQVCGFVVVLVWQWMRLCKAGHTQGRCRSGGGGDNGGGGESTLDSSDLVLSSAASHTACCTHLPPVDTHGAGQCS